MKKLMLICIIILFSMLKINIVSAENVYKKYEIGDKIRYNEIDFYVIEDSDSKKDYVTLLKSTPLTVDEVNLYGTDANGVNHVNRYAVSSIGVAVDLNGYGGMQYYSSTTCGYYLSNWVSSGCTAVYEKSEIKHVVDAWANDKLNEGDLKEDKLGYKTRLLTYNDLINNLGYENSTYCSGACSYTGSLINVPSWLYNSNYWYWTMSANNDSDSSMWGVSNKGVIQDYSSVNQGGSGAVRPVINLKKEPVGTRKQLTDKEFKIGDVIEYNDMLFYVIKNSTEKDHSVTLLKAEPLTVEEVNKYGGVGTDNNHVNMYLTLDTTSSYYQKAYNQNGYGGMAYYTSETCGRKGIDGCTNVYNESKVKYVIDAWAVDNFKDTDLVLDNLGYKVRLLTYEDLTHNLGYEKSIKCTGGCYYTGSLDNVPCFVYSSKYSYWIMSTLTDIVSEISSMGKDGVPKDCLVGANFDTVVRPVVTLKKITEDNNENVEIEKDEEDIKNEVTKGDNHNQIVSVPDTLLSRSIIFVVIGIALIIVGIVLFVRFRNKNKK